MLWLRPYTWVNRNGSAAIASTGVAVNTANVVFTFKPRLRECQLQRNDFRKSETGYSDWNDWYAAYPFRDKRSDTSCEQVQWRTIDGCRCAGNWSGSALV